MFQYLEDRSDIDRAHKKLSRTMRSAFAKTATRDIGYPGGRVKGAKVATNGQHWFWTDDCDADAFTQRRLNWFGVLSEHPGVSITVEVNTTYEGRNDLAAGFFARATETGLIYLLHSGRVGGGTEGVGKSSFLTWAVRKHYDVVDVVDSSGEVRSGLIVMPIEGQVAAKSAARYIDLVRGFKKAARTGEIQSPQFLKERREFEHYFSEGRGRRKGRRSSEIDYISRHGEIVDALQLWRSAKRLPRRCRIVKNVYIDLGVANGNDLVEIFEVKPSADRSSIYSAVGQLLVHGRKKPCRMTIVLPADESLAPDLADALSRLQIDEVRFELTKDSVSILDQ
ncbi:hypothetical protein EDE08_105293 [Bradyrhizobium sp. R2.2-H]|uniref:hypothetical protein n=1 Tax=unclassified Bradyrhizobium TaxID=2631580 RepID=UPI001044EDBF|nr:MULTISPECIES: hypothetical protein [unclassified Bradyrhizobium]TCU72433.1 hypothetical protein EDE10_105293 [Bradyrhizobium sp. Y-H1]TCU74554.1 hypothetical protein EDE08_105293 [Bradyrhizobium sp. R2.2-H]